MKLIDFKTISKLKLQPLQCIKWAEYILKNKYSCILPAKISINMGNNIFVNTMPSYIPIISRYGVKIVSRYPNRTPTLLSKILLYSSTDGMPLAMMDGTWITAMRTGAVAALTINSLQNSHASKYAFMGLGNTARATLLCLTELLKNREMHIKLLAYKGQEQLFRKRFIEYPNLHFEIYSDVISLIKGSDVVVSCITAADHIIASDDCFNEGILIVPVHTRGFQNCDLFFDKVFADDTEHVKKFRYFDRFKKFDEFSQVLLGKNLGRENDKERILAYNIGISLHDIYFASQIYDIVCNSAEDLNMENATQKFWL